MEVKGPLYTLCEIQVCRPAIVRFGWHPPAGGSSYEGRLHISEVSPGEMHIQ